MFNFFADADARQGNKFIIRDKDYNHIVNVLRMEKGDEFLVSCQGKSSFCRLEEIYEDFLTAEIITEDYKETELGVEIHLFQGLPKADKMELIIQKCTELGVKRIIPVEMSRCVVKLDEKKKISKVSRWQGIAESAAKQSKRNIIPEVSLPLSYKQALEKAKQLDMVLLPYENQEGMTATLSALKKIKPGMSVGIFIGPEGGFEENEVSLAKEAGCRVISLGKRILRTETAAITATAMCMLYAEMLPEDKKND